MAMRSALFHGKVRHTRVRPKAHRLQYSVFSMLIDLDELEALDRKFWGFGVNRPSLISFRERDHGKSFGEQGTPLKERVRTMLREAGHETGPNSGISVLCYPRILGYVFNPLTVYYVRDEKGVLQTIIYEVVNTFKERHFYLLPVAHDGAPNDEQEIAQTVDKQMYVSPFSPLEGHYDFKMRAPDRTVLASVRLSDGEGPLLLATFEGRREELTRSSILKAWARYPLMTLKVTVAIHYEALKLFVKRVPVFRHVPKETVDVVTTA